MRLLFALLFIGLSQLYSQKRFNTTSLEFTFGTPVPVFNDIAYEDTHNYLGLNALICLYVTW